MRGKRRNWIWERRPRGHTHLSYREYKLTECLFRAYHCKCAEKFLTELNSDIDQAAEVDSAVFLKKVNNSRNFSCTNAGSEIKFENVICRDAESIASGWGEYFRKLYSDRDQTHYDSIFKREVEQRVKNIRAKIASDRNSNSTYISVYDVKKADKILKKEESL